MSIHILSYFPIFITLNLSQIQLRLVKSALRPPKHCFCWPQSKTTLTIHKNSKNPKAGISSAKPPHILGSRNHCAVSPALPISKLNPDIPLIKSTASGQVKPTIITFNQICLQVIPAPSEINTGFGHRATTYKKATIIPLTPVRNRNTPTTKLTLKATTTLPNIYKKRIAPPTPSGCLVRPILNPNTNIKYPTPKIMLVTKGRTESNCPYKELEALVYSQTSPTVLILVTKRILSCT